VSVDLDTEIEYEISLNSSSASATEYADIRGHAFVHVISLYESLAVPTEVKKRRIRAYIYVSATARNADVL
jgi:hypothetical protein